LRREDDDYFLVTPVEKVRIQVDDAPFIATSLVTKKQSGEQMLYFTTNVGDEIVAEQGHAISVDYKDSNEPAEPRPYIHVRAGLNALITRSVFYQLVDLARGVEKDSETVLVVDSSGTSFSLGKL